MTRRTAVAGESGADAASGKARFGPGPGPGGLAGRPRVIRQAMLYERWRQVAAERRSERAVRDLAAGRDWTFGELLGWSDRAPAPAGPVAFPQGQGAGFLLEVLAAWRHGRCCCPLEPDQTPPGMPPPPATIVHLKGTSATTGTARWVAMTAEQLAADPAQIVAAMGLRPDWPNLGAISLAHSYGFSNLVLPLLLHGIPLVLAGSALPAAVQQAAAGEPAITLAGVPALWRAWHDAGAIPDGVQRAISAGAPLPLQLETAVFRERGLKIHNFYGSSECGGIAYDGSRSPRVDATLAGTAIAGVSLAVAEDGCLEVRGPNVAETYWPEPSMHLGGGCFHTRDLVELEGDRLRLLGRADDLINVAGRKVAPEAVERTLLAHPSVREVLVLALRKPDAPRGDTLAAVVVGSRPVTETTLRRFLRERLPAWQIPRVWHFADGLGTNLRGKVSRADWVARLTQNLGPDDRKRDH